MSGAAMSQNFSITSPEIDGLVSQDVGPKYFFVRFWIKSLPVVHFLAYREA